MGQFRVQISAMWLTTAIVIFGLNLGGVFAVLELMRLRHIQPTRSRWPHLFGPPDVRRQRRVSSCPTFGRSNGADRDPTGFGNWILPGMVACRREYRR